MTDQALEPDHLHSWAMTREMADALGDDYRHYHEYEGFRTYKRVEENGEVKFVEVK